MNLLSTEKQQFAINKAIVFLESCQTASLEDGTFSYLTFNGAVSGANYVTVKIRVYRGEADSLEFRDSYKSIFSLDSTKENKLQFDNLYKAALKRISDFETKKFMSVFIDWDESLDRDFKLDSLLGAPIEDKPQEKEIQKQSESKPIKASIWVTFLKIITLGLYA